MKKKMCRANSPVVSIVAAAAFLILSACVPVDNQNSAASADGNANAGNAAVDQTSAAQNSGNHGQTTEPAANSAAQNTNAAPQFAEAARKNLETETTLKWLFGKRPQTGWYLYKPLIAATIGVAPDAAPDRFAEALARWQRSTGLAPTGIFDEDTMFAFVGEWQKHRLFSRGIAASTELVVGRPADFYDPSRAETLRQIDRETYDAYRRMVQAAAADPALKLKTADGMLAPDEKFLKIVSAFRTREYQQKLREASPNSGRAGLAVNSPHFTGRALDLYVGGEPVSTADENRRVQINTPVYLWMVKNAGRFGFRPYFYEPWHWEHVPE